MKEILFDVFALCITIAVTTVPLYWWSKLPPNAKKFGLLPAWVGYTFWIVLVVIPAVVLTAISLFSSR